MKRALLVVACVNALAAAPNGAEAERASADSRRITQREVDGETLWSIRASSAYADLVLGALAAEAGRPLAGLDRIEDARLHEPLEIALVDRPLAACVRVIAGAVGLHARVDARSIELLPDLADSAPKPELVEAAIRAWVQFARDHAGHELAAEAELALGDLRQEAGDLAAARAHYAVVAREHPASPRLPEALLRQGLVEQRMEDWSAAAESFVSLARIERPHAHHARARLELARTLVWRGDGRQALFLLDALERTHPAADAGEIRSRLYVRAAASIQDGQAEAGLVLLDRADREAAPDERDPDALAFRAEALEGLGRPADAAQVWLERAGNERGDRRDLALICAARLSLAAGDALAVLFVDRLAAGTNAAVEITPMVEKARASLGLAGALPAERREQALQRAEDLILTHGFARARGLLAGLWTERERLDEGGWTRLAVLYARALDAEEGLDGALAVLREALDHVQSDELRRALHVCAGELYEAHARFDEAIAVYGGRF